MADWGFQIPGFAGEEDDELAKLFGMPYEMAKVPDQTINFDDIGGQSFSLPPVSSPSPFALEPLAAPAPAQELPSPEYMNPGRVSRLNEIDVALKELQKAQTERALASQTTPRMTGDQAFATTVASALPLILGRLFAGNSGGAIGGQVGLGIAKGAEEGYDKQNKETQARSKAEYDAGKVELSDLIQQKRGLQTQAFGAEDRMREIGARDKLTDENRGDQQAFQQRLRAQSQTATEGRMDEREKNAANRQDEVSSRPYNKALFDEQKQARALIEKGQSIIALAKQLDPEGKENVAEAFARGKMAGIFKDSQAAELQREQMQFIFSSLKTFFPGAISDQERNAAEQALGGKSGTPLKTVAGIMEKAINRAVKLSNSNRDSLIESGYHIKFPELENPFEAQTTAPPGAPPPNMTFEQFQQWKRSQKK